MRLTTRNPDSFRPNARLRLESGINPWQANQGLLSYKRNKIVFRGNDRRFFATTFSYHTTYKKKITCEDCAENTENPKQYVFKRYFLFLNNVFHIVTFIIFLDKSQKMGYYYFTFYLEGIYEPTYYLPTL